MAARGSRSTTTRKSSKTVKISPAGKAAYGEIKQGIRHVEKSIGEVQKGLRKAEKAIEADAKARIRELRKEGKVQLNALRTKRKEATRLMKSLSAAAEDSWHIIQKGAEQVFADARAAAGTVSDRIRAAIHR
jgi:hypothetical protein